MGFSLTGNADEVIATFQAKKDILQADLAPANAQIITLMKQRLEVLYGPKLAAKWEEQSYTGGPPMLAKVQVETTHPYVYGYEFGTRPHEIAGKNSPRQMLAFVLQGATGLSFFRRVHHPGTAGKDRRQSVQAALAFYALDEWAKALDEALTQTS